MGTAETAWQLSEAFGTTAQFWLNMQSTYDLVHHRPEVHVARIMQYRTGKVIGVARIGEVAMAVGRAVGRKAGTIRARKTTVHAKRPKTSRS